MYFDCPSNIPQDKIESRMKELAKKIGYEYHDISWLKRAFYTEATFNTNKEKYANSPLATLGDRVLSLIITENLFDENKTSEEITNKKIEKERNSTLFKINDALKLFSFAYNKDYFFDEAPLEKQLPNSKHNRYFEALIAAVYKDCGYSKCKEIYEKIERNMKKDENIES